LLSPISFITVLKRLLTIAVLVAAFFLSAGLVIYLAYGGREVKVPELIGRTQAEARSQLEGLGLRMRVTASAPSDKIEVDKVSEQDPRPGLTVKTGQSVRVIVSSGAPTAASPAPKPTPKLTSASPEAGTSETRKPEDRKGEEKKPVRKPEKNNANKPPDAGKTGDARNHN